MEGVTFAFRDCQRVLRDAGSDFSRLLAVGGGSKSDLWLKLIATTLDIEVALPEDGDFGGALGVARLGLCAAEGADPAEIMTMPGIKRVITPDRSLTTAYSDYALSRALSRHRGGPQVTDFFKGISPVKFEGQASSNPWHTATTTRTRSSSARRWRSIFAPPSLTGTLSPGKAATRSAAALSIAHGMPAARWKAQSSRPTSPSSCSTARCAVLLLP